MHIFSKMILALSLGLIAPPIDAKAQSVESVSVIVFPGGFNWPIWIAQDKGFFAKGGIEAKLTRRRARPFSSRI